jgi:GGDEF domain-containing protein
MRDSSADFPGGPRAISQRKTEDFLFADLSAGPFRGTHDRLSGVSNRGVILDTLCRERSRHGSSFAIVLADRDHFKYVTRAKSLETS